MISKEGEEQLEAIMKPLMKRIVNFYDYADGFGEAMRKWEKENGDPEPVETLEMIQMLIAKYTPPKHKDMLSSMMAGMLAGFAASKSKERLK